MNLTDMITLVRRDLKDETSPYRWSDDELTRHIERAVKELSERVPLPAMALLPTTVGSREVDISSLSDRIMVQAVEYPVDEFPIRYQRFSVWGDTVTLITGDVPNGGNCHVYYGTVHTLNALGSTIPLKHEDIVTAGAAGYALEAYADHSLAELAQTSLESADTALARVAGQVTKAETALTNAAAVDSEIASKLTAATAEVDKASAAIATAIATGAGSIDEAIGSYLTSAQTRIDAAVTNLSSAETALASIPARLTQAVTDLATGDDLINTVNVGGDAAGKWAEYAGKETEIARGYNRQADDYLSEAARNLDGAGQELGAASELSKKRDANLEAGSRYTGSALALTSQAKELNRKRRAYLATASHYIATTKPFLSEADRHQASAAQHSNLSRAFASRAKARLMTFKDRLKRLGRRNRLRSSYLYNGGHTP